MTYQAIGEVLGVSHTMVRKIEQRAFRKIRGHPDVKAARELLEALGSEDRMDPRIYANW